MKKSRHDFKWLEKNLFANFDRPEATFSFTLPRSLALIQAVTLNNIGLSS